MLIWDGSQFQIDASRARNMCDIPLRTEAQKPQFPLPSIWKNVSRGKKQRNSNFPSLSLWRLKHRKPWCLSLQFGRMFPKDGTSCLCSASGDFLIWISFLGITCFSSQKVFSSSICLLASAVVVLETFRTIWCLSHPGRLLASCNLPPRSRYLLLTSRNLLLHLGTWGWK